MEFNDINYLAVLVAGFVNFAIGALWYTVLFGKVWQKESGITQEMAASTGTAGMVTTMGSSFILMTVMALGLAMILSAQVGLMDLMAGLKTGLMAGVMFCAASIGINYLYQRKSMKLFIIDALYQVLYMGISGAILGMWR